MKKKIIINKRTFVILFHLILISISYSFGQDNRNTPSSQKIYIEWNDARPSGTIQVLHGNLSKINIVKGRGKIKNDHFEFTSTGRARIAVEIDNVKNDPGPGASLVSVKTNTPSFSFFLRDVNQQSPIYLPAYAVVVLKDSDNRSYAEVKFDIQSRKLQTKLQKLAAEPEESFDSASKRTLVQSVPTWLGVSRDFRIFQVEEALPHMVSDVNLITPQYCYSPVTLPNINNRPVSYMYVVGRGTSVEINTVRRLEEGTLPILHSTHIDDDIQYHSTSFVSMEHTSLTAEAIKGTHYLVADNYSAGHMFTKEQEENLKPRLREALHSNDETVFYFRSEIVNTAAVPRYAWIKTLKPGRGWWEKYRYSFDPATGMSAYPGDSVFCISKLNGKPLPNEETAILLQPGEKAFFEFFLPHIPLSNERAKKLSLQSFEKRLAECKNFWQAKLKKAAQIHLPEKRIEEMLQAGLLHLDLITYGNEPDGTLAPTIGVYAPIGTESSPIIQFYNSMGWNDIAKRSLTYFLDKQHDDGFMQNFGGYMVETGAVLWSLGEYYRYTRDRVWIEQIKNKVLKSCDFLLKWRADNKIDSLRGKGYGMIAGKVADPEDHFHQFMLNGYAYLGVSRSAELLKEIDPVQADRLQKEADAWKKDIRESFFKAVALSPVVPLGDGRWGATAPPWTEATGPRLLYASKETFFSHGTFTVSDAMLGPLYLVFCEVFNVDEEASAMMLDYHSELFYQNNAAFSQPYYSRHNWVQAKLGLVKPFLKTYYNTFSAIADRDTYTFWEHLYKLSPHKTHEEGWFLMETRWMLYLEDGSTLKLLNTAPRKWLENGKVIDVNGVQSYFGPLAFKVSSGVAKHFIEATIKCSGDRKPEKITIRLPHPDGKKPVKVLGGEYNIETETVTITAFSGEASVRLEY